MQRRKPWGASIVPLMLGFMMAGKLHLVAPSPAVFFGLGVAATLCVVGALYYGWDAIKVARAGKPYGN